MTGLQRRSAMTASVTAARARSISASVLPRPSPKRIEAAASWRERPRAAVSDPRRRQAWEAGGPSAGPGGSGAGDPFATGFPDFDDYLDALLGERRRPAQEQGPPVEREYAAETENETENENEAESAGSVTSSPAPPPPVQASSDQESLVELSPEQALQGERVELVLPDGTAVEVWTPPFAGDGWRLRLVGVTPGGGDHFLQLRVRTDEGLRIDGLRVLYPLELSPAEAALGCQVVVPTLRGPVKLRVPPGSSSGRLLRLRARGQEWGEQRGDQLVEVRIVVPDVLADDEAALYRRLQQLADDPDGGSR